MTKDPIPALLACRPLATADDFIPMAYVFHALSHRTRLKIVQLLSLNGPQTKRSLRDMLHGIDVYEHLKVLHSAGIVRIEGFGRHATWHLVPGSLERISWLITSDTTDPPHPPEL